MSFCWNLQIKIIKDTWYYITSRRKRLLLENEIIKRYFYREGLYEYYLSHNKEIKTAVDILGNKGRYNSYLN